MRKEKVCECGGGGRDKMDRERGKKDDADL